MITEYVHPTEFELRVIATQMPIDSVVTLVQSQSSNIVRKAAHAHCLWVESGKTVPWAGLKRMGPHNGGVLKVHDRTERKKLLTDKCFLCQRNLDDAGFHNRVTEFV